MNFHSFTVNPFSQNTYLVYQGSKAWLIDAGFYHAHEITAFKQFLSEHQLALEAVFLTHAHLDHVFAVNQLVNGFAVPVFLHQEEYILLKRAHQQGAMFGVPMQEISVIPKPLMEAKQFEWNGFECETLFTPGHSPGHISFYFKEENVLIAGDTLFAGSIGRTDLYKGDFSTLEHSIKKKLYTLPDTTRVLSGHGPETTIGQEKRFNPYVKA
jgi:glyoxylase-like metal-dependent hydrolase (beta-lactamase superfamily II)